MTRKPQDHLSNAIYYEGPRAFSRKAIRAQPDLFRHRSALIFTPTVRLPLRYVGHGDLRITLPIAFPSLLDEMVKCVTARFWLDLFQRATGKLRWTPIFPASVEIELFDHHAHCWAGTFPGSKSLIDALKVRSAGRRDGHMLYYFGAIRDDDSTSIVLWSKLRRWPSLRATRCVITVRHIESVAQETKTSQRSNADSTLHELVKYPAHARRCSVGQPTRVPK
jgi:hypothetical protein